MKRTIRIFAIVILAALAACSGKDTGKKSDGTYLAKVGSTTITQADFEREVKALPEYMQGMFQGEAGREKFLGEIVKKEILYQEALKKGLDKKPELQKKIEDFRKSTLASELLSAEVIEKAKVSDQEVKDFYDKNIDEMKPTREIKASHILVKTEDEAKKALARIRKGDKFEDVAKAVSIDPGTAKQGGDLGYFTRGKMVPEFEKAAVTLKVGEISEPIKTQFGFHIIKVTDKKKGPAVGFEEVKGMIMQKLSQEKQAEAFEKYLAELKKTYAVDINKDAIAKMETGKTEKPKQEEPTSGDKKADHKGKTQPETPAEKKK